MLSLEKNLKNFVSRFRLCSLDADGGMKTQHDFVCERWSYISPGWESALNFSHHQFQVGVHNGRPVRAILYVFTWNSGMEGSQGHTGSPCLFQSSKEYADAPRRSFPVKRFRLGRIRSSEGRKKGAQPAKTPTEIACQDAM